MTRSPLSYPLNRGMDLDAGGAADLQTDVMRFMAILSLCLVAIFALVQSLPMTPPTPSAATPSAKPPPDAEPPPARQKRQPRPEPVVRERMPEQAPRPEPRLEKLPPAPVYQALATPESEPAKTPPLASAAAPVPEPKPAPAPTAGAPEDEGFSLRFESDLALRRLVARNEVGLYAMQTDKAFRMSVNRGAASFWPASSPAQFHEMDERTVPNDVIAALRRSGTPGPITWGVTLPSKLSGDLNRYLNEFRGGALVIGGDGSMRRENAGQGNSLRRNR